MLVRVEHIELEKKDKIFCCHSGSRNILYHAMHKGESINQHEKNNSQTIIRGNCTERYSVFNSLNIYHNLGLSAYKFFVLFPYDNLDGHA